MGASIVSTVTTAFSGFLTGIGTSIVDAFDTFIVTTDGSLTNLAAWGLTFLGVGFAVGIVAWLRRKA